MKKDANYNFIACNYKLHVQDVIRKLITLN